MKVLWMHVPPQTFWGWVFEIALVLGVLWLLWAATLVMALLFGCIFEGWLSPGTAAIERVVADEHRSYLKASQSIEQLRRRAEGEIRSRSSG